MNIRFREDQPRDLVWHLIEAWCHLARRFSRLLRRPTT